MKILNWEKFLEGVSIENNKFEYYLPTYEEAREICDTHDNFIFYESKQKIQGFDVSIFNYRLAFQSHFTNPIEGKDIKAHEMRGLTFVFNSDGTIFNRFLLLDKFFNVDQTPCSMYSILKDYKIKNIFNKEDGSIASFIKLPNGNVVGKSKTSFESDQAIGIQKIYDEDKNIQRFVNWSLDNEIMPIFEYVSPQNRIVLSYANTKLILLRMRDNKTGEYLDINNFSKELDGISVVESEDGHTLDDLIELSKITQDKEGWVVQFQNGKMAKIKTPWYLERHSLMDKVDRENTLIKMIVEENIDDVIAQLSEDSPRRLEIRELSSIINSYIKKTSDRVDDLLLNYSGSKKDFAISYRNHKLFPIAIGVIGGKDKMEMIKNRILSDTRNLMDARKWIKENGNL
jgi:T4 RnlA family RNA ligase